VHRLGRGRDRYDVEFSCVMGGSWFSCRMSM
jgi:hypothetical protein